MIIWLDEYIGRDENCRKLKMEFRRITKSLKMVDSVDNCRKCLQHVENRKVFFIIQGKHAKEIVPDIVRMVSPSPSMKPVVYIFCLHIIYLSEWAQEQECIMEGGMFDHEKDLLLRLTKDVNDYVKKRSLDYENVSKLVISFLEKFKQLYERCCRARDDIPTPAPINQVAAIIAQ
ncbi:unnamed protein product [Rotaria magnacalcarata]|uniref:Uncharacterized protein n=2 Tax=Rotaria magnacalcarata TaxID=392030 RepID=A0A816VZG4_9BILA|nr:unnamed protein product [Rotaria magnacalcarata]CAF2129791.1 unnamed protein product [Rotaria magnacalcarata]